MIYHIIMLYHILLHYIISYYIILYYIICPGLGIAPDEVGPEVVPLRADLRGRASYNNKH